MIPAWVQSNRVYLAKSNERLTKGSRDYSDALIENVITYDGTIGKHHINVLAGQTYEEEDTDLLTGWGINFTEPYFLQLQNASDTYSNSYEYKHSILSYIGRINYNYDDRYLFSATVRRDGSSRLTRNIRWGTFPSVSVGWRFDKEKFFPFDQNVVNLFKVRASYGELGNENIGEYMYQAVMSRNNMTYNFNGNVVTGSAVSLSWTVTWHGRKRRPTTWVSTLPCLTIAWNSQPNGTRIPAKTCYMLSLFPNRLVYPIPPLR